MMNKSTNNIKEEDPHHTRKSRSFIFFMGILLLILTAYIYSFQSIWVTAACGVTGILMIGAARYARKKTISLLESLWIGWP